EQAITIQSNSGLSDDEIDRMMKDAEANAEEDKKRKEEADLRNEVEQLIFQVEKTTKELDGKVDQAELDKANNLKDELKQAQEDNDLDKMKDKKEELSQVVQELSVKLYEQAQQEQANAEGDSSNDNTSGD